MTTRSAAAIAERAGRPAGLLVRYARWLHLQWPSGKVDRLPNVNEDFSTDVPGLYVAGDLAGVPLLKFAVHSGTRAVENIAKSLPPQPRGGGRDLIIVGAGVAGIAAALKARELGLDFTVVEAAAPFNTLHELPAQKPIYTYPTAFAPEGHLRVTAPSKEALLAELEAQLSGADLRWTVGEVTAVRRSGAMLQVVLSAGEPLLAARVLIAVGRTGRSAELGVEGERLPHVHHRLIDPSAHAGERAVVIGGGDSAVEAAVALAERGAAVTLVHRKAAFWRAKPANLERLSALVAAQKVELALETVVTAISPSAVSLRNADHLREAAADAVFVLIGRDAPLELFRRSGVSIRGELRPWSWAALAAFVGACALLYDWKGGGALHRYFAARGAWPFSLVGGLESAGPLLKTVKVSASAPAFWYTLAYSIVVVTFGVRRIRKRPLPYIKAQTWTLIAVQVIPLFVLPELLLPYLEHSGLLPASVADPLFPRVGYGHGRELWRAYGLVLAWPLFVYNVFTSQPLGAWLGISLVQTFVLIPLGIRYFGKGFYCGFICSCGALAETLGDAHRQKMPHGPGWNRLNLAGQALLLLALLLLALRIAGWILPGADAAERSFQALQPGWSVGVDLVLAGVIGVGLYFWFSGRVWCRFFCPLAALMHIYTRFSRFRIFPRKERCISCGVCTSVCHQGIDVMAFAARGEPMADPQCVRCGACVASCPTGVLEFGRFGGDGLVHKDRLNASPVLLAERSTGAGR